MLCTLRKTLSLSLILLFAATPILRAQSQSAQAPIPPQITSAHTVFLSNAGAPNLYEAFTGGPNRAYNTLYADLQQWNHYQIVATPAQADLILEISAVAPVLNESRVGLIYNPQLILRILDPSTKAILWTTTANVRAGGRQKSRDKGFDESVAVLVTQLRQLNGETLTPEQTADVHRNSHFAVPLSFKVLFAVGIAAVAGLTAYGLYRVNHPPTLPTPTLP